jgi:hypothetical protein
MRYVIKVQKHADVVNLGSRSFAHRHPICCTKNRRWSDPTDALVVLLETRPSMEKGSAVFRVKYAHVEWALICDLRDCLAHPGSYGLILRVREKRPILSFKFAKRGEKRPTESVSPDRRQQCSVSRMRGRFSRPRAEPVSSRPIYARRRQVGRPSRGGPARAPINQPLIIRRAQRERER